MSRWWLLGVAALVACGSSEAREQHRTPPDWRTLTASRQVSGEKILNADIEYGAGQLTIAPAAAGTLYQTDLKYDNNQLTPDVTYSDGTLHFGLKGGHIRGYRGKGGEMSRLDLRFGPDVPLNLDLKFGAGQATVDLGGLNVASARIATGASAGQLKFSQPTKGTCQDLDLQVGAARMEVAGIGNLSPQSMNVQGGVGDVTLDFSGAWRNDTHAKISMGIGELHMNVPRSVGVRVHKSSMLASFEAPDMVKQGDLYLSKGYQSAQRHIDIDIDAAFGEITLGWVGAAATGDSF